MNPEKYQNRLAQIRKAAVYCGAHDAASEVFADAVTALAHFLVRHNITLVYGGSNVGTMKLLADTVLAGGGKVIGVFTGSLPEKLMHPGLTETYVAGNLAERKAKMLELADVVIALPGSFGTWDELFDALALRKIRSGGHHAPVGVLNVNGYYDLLLQFIRQSVDAGFTAPHHAELLQEGKTPEELFRKFAGLLVTGGQKG